MARAKARAKAWVKACPCVRKRVRARARPRAGAGQYGQGGLSDVHVDPTHPPLHVRSTLALREG